jgi:hypothetical protein
MQGDLLRKEVFLVEFVFCAKIALVALILIRVFDNGALLPKDESSAVSHLTTANGKGKAVVSKWMHLAGNDRNAHLEVLSLTDSFHYPPFMPRM